MTDFLEVKAKRTFLVGKEVKTKRSDPFPIEAGEARQLKALGLVDIVGAIDIVDEIPVDEVSGEIDVSETETETETETAVPAKRGRKAKANDPD